MVLNLVVQLGDVRRVVELDKELRVRAVRLFGRVGQQESRRAGADDRADVFHALEAQQVLLDACGMRIALLDRRALWQPVVDHDLWSRGIGKKALLDVAEAVNGTAENEQHKGDGQPANLDASAQKAAEHAIEAAVRTDPHPDRLPAP